MRLAKAADIRPGHDHWENVKRETVALLKTGDVNGHSVADLMAMKYNAKNSIAVAICRVTTRLKIQLTKANFDKLEGELFARLMNGQFGMKD